MRLHSVSSVTVAGIPSLRRTTHLFPQYTEHFLLVIVPSCVMGFFLFTYQIVILFSGAMYIPSVSVMPKTS